MNVITIAGKIGKDAVLRATDKSQVAGFSVADDQGYGDKKTTIWYDCAIWGDRAEKLAQYLIKGQSVTVTGTLGTREHDGKTYLTVRVNEIALQGGKQERKPDTDRVADATAKATKAVKVDDPFADSDIPF